MLVTAGVTANLYIAHTVPQIRQRKTTAIASFLVNDVYRIPPAYEMNSNPLFASLLLASFVSVKAQETSGVVSIKASV